MCPSLLRPLCSNTFFVACFHCIARRHGMCISYIYLGGDGGGGVTVYQYCNRSLQIKYISLNLGKQGALELWPPQHTPHKLYFTIRIWRTSNESIAVHLDARHLLVSKLCPRFRQLCKYYWYRQYKAGNSRCLQQSSSGLRYGWFLIQQGQPRVDITFPLYIVWLVVV